MLLIILYVLEVGKQSQFFGMIAILSAVILTPSMGYLLYLEGKKKKRTVQLKKKLTSRESRAKIKKWAELKRASSSSFVAPAPSEVERASTNMLERQLNIDLDGDGDIGIMTPRGPDDDDIAAAAARPELLAEPAAEPLAGFEGGGSDREPALLPGELGEIPQTPPPSSQPMAAAVQAAEAKGDRSAVFAPAVPPLGESNTGRRVAPVGRSSSPVEFSVSEEDLGAAVAR
jgi:hypothetical protein